MNNHSIHRAAVAKEPHRKAPAFQFYARDYVADIRVRAMTYEQRGIYVELLCLCWLEHGLPADLETLAMILGVPRPRLQKVWPAIGACFRSEGDRLQHNRLDAQRVEFEAYRAQQSASGKAGAMKRWHGDPSGGAIATPMANDGSASATASAACDLQDDRRVSPERGRTPEILQPARGEQKRENVAVVASRSREQWSERTQHVRDSTPHHTTDTKGWRFPQLRVGAKLHALIVEHVGADGAKVVDWDRFYADAAAHIEREGRPDRDEVGWLKARAKDAVYVARAPRLQTWQEIEAEYEAKKGPPMTPEQRKAAAALFRETNARYSAMTPEERKAEAVRLRGERKIA